MTKIQKNEEAIIEAKKVYDIAEALAWQHSFDRLYANRIASGGESVERWQSAKEMFNWYINEDKRIPKEQLRFGEIV